MERSFVCEKRTFFIQVFKMANQYPFWKKELETLSSLVNGVNVISILSFCRFHLISLFVLLESLHMKESMPLNWFWKRKTSTILFTAVPLVLLSDQSFILFVYIWLYWFVSSMICREYKVSPIWWNPLENYF